MKVTDKYGRTALVAGASEGIGAAFAEYLAQSGMDLILIARRADPLHYFAVSLQEKYGVKVRSLPCDLSDMQTLDDLKNKLKEEQIDVFVYNAVLPYIGPFEESDTMFNDKMVTANIQMPTQLVHWFGSEMLARKRGAVILMASLAGFQGSGFLSLYAATKAFNRILAESLWYEWKDKGIDVIACCAGATSTPNYLKTNPGKTSMFAPRVQTPQEVVNECFQKLGKQPSFISGTGNKFASFIMQRFMPRKIAIEIMGDTTRKMYRINK